MWGLIANNEETCLGEGIEVGGLIRRVFGMQLEEIDDVLRLEDVTETLEVSQCQLSGNLDAFELEEL